MSLIGLSIRLKEIIDEAESNNCSFEDTRGQIERFLRKYGVELKVLPNGDFELPEGVNISRTVRDAVIVLNSFESPTQALSPRDRAAHRELNRSIERNNIKEILKLLTELMEGVLGDRGAIDPRMKRIEVLLDEMR